MLRAWSDSDACVGVMEFKRFGDFLVLLCGEGVDREEHCA